MASSSPHLPGDPGNDAPDKALTCSMARYAFEAYLPAPQFGDGVRYYGVGQEKVLITFLDRDFVEGIFDQPNGGILEVVFNDHSTSAFDKAELVMDVHSFGAPVKPAPAAASLISDVSVNLLTRGHAVLGVRDKTQDKLGLAMSTGSGPKFTAELDLNDVPGDGLAWKTVTLRQAAAVPGLADEIRTVSFSWHLIPFSQCTSDGKRQLLPAPAKPQPGPSVPDAPAPLTPSEPSASPAPPGMAPPDWDALSDLVGGPKLHTLAVVYCPITNIQVWLHRSKDNRQIVIANRGTNWDTLMNFIEDVVVDFDSVVDLQPASTPKTIEALVHTGFNASYHSVRGTLMVILHEILANNNSTHADNADNDAGTGAQVIFTGHSLGGALGTLGSYDLALRQLDGFAKSSILLFTFGCPRVGNEAFMGQFNALVPNTWRFTNTLDVIPRVPETGKCPNDPSRYPYYLHVGAHWDLEAPEPDEKKRVGKAADWGDQRPSSELGLLLGEGLRHFPNHSDTAYYDGLRTFFGLALTNGSLGHGAKVVATAAAGA